MVRCVVPLTLVNFAAAIRGGKHPGRHLQNNGIVVVPPVVDDQLLLAPKYSPVESPSYVEPSYIQPNDTTPGNERSKFEKECYAYLLSKYVADDELISQHDFASFLTEYCRWENVCDKSETLEFEMLPSPIQIAFADPLCEGENMCIKEGQEDFGYVYNKSTYDETETQIASLCATLYPLVGQYVSSTPAPSVQSGLQRTPEPYPNSPVYSDGDPPEAKPTKFPKGDSPVMAPVYPVSEPSTPPTTGAPESSPVVSASPSTMPVIKTASPSTAAPSSPFPTAAPLITMVPDTGIPTLLPSSTPSVTAATVFVNELGTVNGTEFIEITYSSFLASGIVYYTFDLYSEKGIVLASGNFSEGTSTVSSRSFTYALYPDTTEPAPAVGVVDDNMDVLYFVSRGVVVTAVDGPAKGMISTDILATTGADATKVSFNDTHTRRKMANNDDNADSSFGLVGTGCDFTDFVFAEIPASPGYVNQGQQVLDCADTETPSAAPAIRIGGENGVGTGAIVGISVSAFLLLGVLVYLLCGGDKGERATDDVGEGTKEVEEEPLVEPPTKPSVQPKTKMIFELNEELLAQGDEIKKTFSIATGEVLMIDTGDDIDVDAALLGPTVAVTPNIARSASPSVAPSGVVSVASGNMPKGAESGDVMTAADSVTPSVAKSVVSGTMSEGNGKPIEAQSVAPSVTPSVAFSIGSGKMPDEQQVDAQSVTPSIARSVASGTMPHATERDGDQQSVTPSVAFSIGSGTMPNTDEPSVARSVAKSVASGKMPDVVDVDLDQQSVTPSVAFSIGSGKMPHADDQQGDAQSVTPSVARSVASGTMADAADGDVDQQSVTPSVAFSIGSGKIPYTDEQLVDAQSATQSMTPSIARSVGYGAMPEVAEEPESAQSERPRAPRSGISVSSEELPEVYEAVDSLSLSASPSVSQSIDSFEMLDRLALDVNIDAVGDTLDVTRNLFPGDGSVTE